MDHLFEARAEFRKYFRCIFWKIEDTKISFWGFLTFSRFSNLPKKLHICTYIIIHTTNRPMHHSCGIVSVSNDENISNFGQLWSYVNLNLVCTTYTVHSQLLEIKSVQVNFVVNIFWYCGSIIDFLRNPYFILQICHDESFKMRYIRSLYLNFSLKYS